MYVLNHIACYKPTSNRIWSLTIQPSMIRQGEGDRRHKRKYYEKKVIRLSRNLPNVRCRAMRR